MNIWDKVNKVIVYAVSFLHDRVIRYESKK